MQTSVHQLWPPPGDLRKTEMNILFFHSFPRDPDEWKSAWTQRSQPNLCWPEKWLPADLGFDVRVLFVSYGVCRVDDVVDDLFKALVIRDEWDLCKNHQPLVLVGRGFGTLVLDKLFLLATKELLTRPTEAGAFVKNVRGVTLYEDNIEDHTKSYEIENFFGGTVKHVNKFKFGTSGSFHHVTQGSMLINPAVYGKNLTHVVGIDVCQWIKEHIWEASDNELRWKPENKQSRGYNVLLESCQMVYQFEAIRSTLENLQLKLDNVATECDISNYSDSMFENEFTYLRHNGIEGAKILIVQRMLATMGVDVEKHMAAEKSDGEQLNERKLDVLKFTVARFCENHEWHMVPEMRESDMQTKIKSVLNDIVDEIPPLSDDIMNEKMHRERGRESIYHPDREAFESIYHPDREAFRRDGNDTVPIHFPSSREQSIKSVKQLQQLARNMRPGENLPQEDVQEQLTAHMAQVLHGGKLIVTAKILEGNIQFLFGNAKSMAQIVGVGLDFATVSMTPQNVIVVEGITELEWTRLWGEVFLGESLFENSIFMENVVISPPDHEKPQGSHVNALSKVAMFFMIKKFLQNLDVGKVYNQVVRGVATTMAEENKSDIGQVHAKSVDDPSTGILGFNFLESWDYFSSFPSERGLGSATRGTSGAGGSHVGGTDIPSEGDKDQGGDGGEDDDNGKDNDNGKGRGAKGNEKDDDNGKGRGAKGNEEDDDNGKGRGAKGNEIRQNNQPNVLVTVIPGSHHGFWNRNPVPEQLEGSDIDPIPEQLECSDIDPIPEQLEGSDIDPIPEQLKGSHITPRLKFLFKKTEYIIESDVSVTCCMKEGSSCEDLKRFGWFHNELHVSFQCLEPDAATPYPSEILGSQRLRNTISVQTQATPSQFVIDATGACCGLASALVSWTMPSNVQTNQREREEVSDFISDTRFRAYCVDGGGETGVTPVVGYNFKLRPEILTNKLPDSSDEESHKGSLSTVSPHFKADWIVTRQDKICKYVLNVKRHACELVLVAGERWKRNSCTCHKMLQTYMVTLYINHNMSNIATRAELERPLCKTHRRNKLIGINMHPSSRAFDEASSSTQQHTL